MRQLLFPILLSSEISVCHPFRSKRTERSDKPERYPGPGLVIHVRRFSKLSSRKYCFVCTGRPSALKAGGKSKTGLPGGIRRERGGRWPYFGTWKGGARRFSSPQTAIFHWLLAECIALGFSVCQSAMDGLPNKHLGGCVSGCCGCCLCCLLP